MDDSRRAESPRTHESLEAMLCRHTNRLVVYLDQLIPGDLRRLIDSHDVAQDTFILAARCVHRASFDEPDAAWRWLATIGRNCLIDAVRLQRAAKRGGGGRLRHLLPEEAGHSSVIDVLEALGVDRRTPSRSAMRREFLSVLGECLQRLEPAYRQAVTLRYIEGMSLQETASKMSRTEDSARKLCVRGLRALRLELRTVSLFI